MAIRKRNPRVLLFQTIRISRPLAKPHAPLKMAKRPLGACLKDACLKLAGIGSALRRHMQRRACSRRAPQSRFCQQPLKKAETAPGVRRPCLPAPSWRFCIRTYPTAPVWYGQGLACHSFVFFMRVRPKTPLCAQKGCHCRHGHESAQARRQQAATGLPSSAFRSGRKPALKLKKEDSPQRGILLF